MLRHNFFLQQFLCHDKQFLCHDTISSFNNFYVATQFLPSAIFYVFDKQFQCRDTVLGSSLFYVSTNEQKIGFFGRFFGEKSVFGRHGNDFDKKKKSEEKKSVKNWEKSPIFWRKIRKIRYFPENIRFFPKFGVNYILGH